MEPHLDPAIKLEQGERQELLKRSRQILHAASELFLSASNRGLNVEADFQPLFQQLEEPFSVFVCGEFNSGKSSILNALAGEKLAETGVLPTTKRIEVLRSVNVAGLNFVDSPGLNSIIEGHQEITEKFLQRADVILFVTSVERALTESEAAFLLQVKNAWARKVILVVNKIDLITAEERASVESFVRKGLQQTAGLDNAPQMVSAKSGEGIDRLKQELSAILTDVERFRLKLKGPQSSLTRYIGQLKELSQEDRLDAEEELTVLQKVMERVSSRLEEGKQYISVFTKQIHLLMQEIVVQINGLIDERFGFVDLMKAKVFGNDAGLNSTLSQIMKRLEVEKRITLLIEDVAQTVQRYRDTVLKESSDELKLASMLKGSSSHFPSIAPQAVDVRLLGDELRTSAKEGLRNSIALGGAAAATGLGIKVATAGVLLEFSAVFLALGLALLSLRALPHERKKAKLKVEKVFRESGDQLCVALNEDVAKKLQEVNKEIDASLRPAIQKLESRVGNDRELIASLLAIEEQSQTLLRDLSSVS